MSLKLKKVLKDKEKISFEKYYLFIRMIFYYFYYTN
jgi:hypothetical protein